MIAHLPMSADLRVRPREALHVLTLTPFYPRDDDDAQGCFVAEPLPWTEQYGIANTVFAAQPFYRGRARTSRSATPIYWNHFFAVPGGFGLPTAGAFLYASTLAGIRKLHGANPIHLIHAHSALPCGHAAALLSRELGIPFVVTVHGLDAFSNHQVKGYAGKWCQRVSQWVYRAARQVICVSGKVREQVMREAAGADPAVIYNGVDPQLFSPGETPSDATGAAILSVGNLIPSKGHELLLRGLAAVRRNHPDVSCEIIGDGPERGPLTRLASELGIADKVCFRGRQSRTRVAQAVRACTVFALPSRYEALGCVYLEAMSAGKPVIACRGQGIEEVIQQNTNGVLINPEDLGGLEDALSQLLLNSQLRHQIGRAARQTILRGFTLAHQGERLAQLYQDCAT